MTLHVGIIGFPVGHSVSPAFQQAAFDHLRLDARYERWETPPDRLREVVERLRGEGYLGANVTVPHKQAVISLLDEMDAQARRIGAVNTIVNRKGRLTGYNTDAPGFLRALREDARFEPSGKRALIVGAGGAARAVAFALADAKAAGIVIANRNLDRAQALADAVGAGGAKAVAMELQRGWVMGAPTGIDLVVNCTTVGMRSADTEGESPLDAAHLRREMLVCDLVYNPAETTLMRAARKLGCRVLGGLPMLVYQGALAFEMWTGKKAPVDVMRRAAEQALKA